MKILLQICRNTNTNLNKNYCKYKMIPTRKRWQQLFQLADTLIAALSSEWVHLFLYKYNRIFTPKC